MKKINCFKAYDIRGNVGEELNDDVVWRIGRAYGQFLKPQKVAVGGDARHSSEPLKESLIDGLRAAGVNVLDLGLTGTEEIYFAVFSQNLDGGIQVTGSHNPLTDNGLKLVKDHSRPISGDSGLFEIREIAEADAPKVSSARGSYQKTSFKEEYINHLLSYVDISNIPPLKVLTNAGNGAAGPILDLLEERFSFLKAPLSFVKICHEPDGTFPNGLPNPLLPEKRTLTSLAIKEEQANIGLAWDGDFDRCFFFDEKASFIEGYYTVGLLAEAFLKKCPKASIIHDPRLIWNTIDLVLSNGGKPVESKTGHAFIKERMRQEGAVYGGEMSAHHYFSDFAYCDSGMIPWLLVLELLGMNKTKLLSQLVEKRQQLFPCSGEINYKVESVSETLDAVEKRFEAEAVSVSRTDGLSIEKEAWRFNLRGSNTEPLLRLNLETRGLPAEIPFFVNLIEEVINGVRGESI